jgi:hypothetical protein
VFCAAEKENVKGTGGLGKQLLASVCCVDLLSFSLDEPTDIISKLKRQLVQNCENKGLYS